MARAVRRWNVITERPTRSGATSRTRRSSVSRTRAWTRMRSATATRWRSSRLPAREVSAPLGMRIATGGMCSNQSGIDRSRTFTASLLSRVSRRRNASDRDPLPSIEGIIRCRQAFRKSRSRRGGVGRRWFWPVTVRARPPRPARDEPEERGQRRQGQGRRGSRGKGYRALDLLHGLRDEAPNVAPPRAPLDGEPPPVVLAQDLGQPGRLGDLGDLLQRDALAA